MRGKPASAMVGTSGSVGVRDAPVTASARALPLRICCAAEGSVSKKKATRPAIRSVMAGALPR